MKKILLTALLYIMICPFIYGQGNDVDSKINEIKEYIQNGGDLNKQDKYQSYYYHDFIWDFGFRCDTAELTIVHYLIEQDQKLENPFFFIEDPCLEMRDYIFYYVQLLKKDGNNIRLKTLKNLIAIYLIPFEYSEKSFINLFDFHDKTPLMYACEMSNKRLVRYLLSNNANPQLKNKKGQMASDFCSEEKLKKLLR